MGVVHKVKRAAAAAESQMSNSSSSPTSSSSASPVSKYPRFGKRGAPQAFPSKLYEILEGESPDIVGWTSTGRGFEVRDHARLSSEVLGRFFKQDKFSSFQRQLNLYGFRKVTKGSEAGSYQHPHFRRGERTTLLTIRRSTKASSARVVPNSPAARETPPAVPVSSAASDTGGDAEKPRPATPSPPPEPVRGILPWPKLPAHSAALHLEAGRVSPGGSPSSQSPRVAESEAYKRSGRDQREQERVAGEGNGSWSARGDDSMANAPHARVHAPAAPETAWKMRVPGHTNPMGNDAVAGGGNSIGSSGNSNSSSSSTINVNAVPTAHWGHETAKRERERVQGLDHQDVEVVGLLQRMAKEAQDSPSRQKAAAAARREGTHPQNSPPVASQPSQPLQQPQQLPSQFLAPRPSAPPISDVQQVQQMVFADRLHDIVNHERVNNVPRGAFPYAFGSDGRAPPVVHPHHAQAYLPAPFPLPSALGSGFPDGHRRGDSEGDVRTSLARARSGSGESRVALIGHGHRQQDGASAYETGSDRTGRSGGRGPGSSFRYSYDGANEVDRRVAPETGGYSHSVSWHGHSGPYTVPPMQSTFGKYHGEEKAKFGSAAAPPMMEEVWTQHRPFTGGR